MTSFTRKIFHHFLFQSIAKLDSQRASILQTYHSQLRLSQDHSHHIDLNAFHTKIITFHQNSICRIQYFALILPTMFVSIHAIKVSYVKLIPLLLDECALNGHLTDQFLLASSLHQIKHAFT